MTWATDLLLIVGGQAAAVHGSVMIGLVLLSLVHQSGLFSCICINAVKMIGEGKL